MYPTSYQRTCSVEFFNLRYLCSFFLHSFYMFAYAIHILVYDQVLHVYSFTVFTCFTVFICLHMFAIRFDITRLWFIIMQCEFYKVSYINIWWYIFYCLRKSVSKQILQYELLPSVGELKHLTPSVPQTLRVYFITFTPIYWSFMVQQMSVQYHYKINSPYVIKNIFKDKI